MESKRVGLKGEVEDGLLVLRALGEMFLVAEKRLGGISLENARIYNFKENVWIVSEGKAARISAFKEGNSIRIEVEVFEGLGDVLDIQEGSGLFWKDGNYAFICTTEQRGKTLQKRVSVGKVHKDVAVLIGDEGIEVLSRGKRSFIALAMEMPNISFVELGGKTLLKITDKSRRVHISVDERGEVLYGEGENKFYR